MADAPWAEVVIPTRQSAAWIGTLLAHYRARGFVPTLLLDDRTNDATEAIAREAGCAVVGVSGFTFTEGVVRLTADCVGTDWVLFMHDDEVPSDALFARVRAGRLPPDGVQSVAIPRRWAWHEAGRPLRYGWSPHWGDRTGRSGTDHNWRLFKPREVRFVSEMHTEGFLIDRWSRFDENSYFVHFEWLIRTREEREDKLKRYDAARDGYGRFFERVYLPELQEAGVIRYAEFGTDAYDALALAYLAVRGDGVEDAAREDWRAYAARAAREAALRPPAAMAGSEPADRAGLAPRSELEVPDRSAAR